MGYYAHDTIAFQTVQDEAAERVEAFRAALPETWRRLIVGPVRGAANSAEFWAFLPDGSKEGWDTSNEGDSYRAELIALLDEIDSDYVHVRWGGDWGREVKATIEAESP